MADEQQPRVKKQKTGGRKKGTKNRRTVLLESAEEVCERLGVHPLECLARFIRDEDPATGQPYERQVLVGRGEDAELVTVKGYSSEIRAKCAADLAKYVTPQKKAIEHSGPGGQPIAPPSLSVTFV